MQHLLRVLSSRFAHLPSYGMVRFGSLGRTTPIEHGFDHERGKFIDRYYIDQFMQQRASFIRGNALEIEGDIYTRLFGGDRVTHCDVLDLRPGHHGATITGDLTSPDCLAANAYDCEVVTQTLNYLYDVRSAIRTLWTALKPGGSLIVSVSGIAQIAPEEARYCGDFWRFTSFSLHRHLEEFFPPDQIEVIPYGNVLSAIAFLHGLAAEELKEEDLQFNDPEYQLVICAHAVKQA
jgi:SAM-dependent methyltransferase